MSTRTQRRIAPLVGAAVLLITVLAATDDEPKPQPAQVVGITDSPTSRTTFEWHRSITTPTEA